MLFYLTASTNPCAIGAAELYHPYPGDSTRYIQCSQWGHSFVKWCGFAETWDNDLKTCTHKSASVSPQPQPHTHYRIYTTGPQGYPGSVHNGYDQYGYHSANGNDRQHQEEPEYYIDANNNVGQLYAPHYNGAFDGGKIPANLQYDVENTYNQMAIHSSDGRRYPAEDPAEDNRHSLFNALVNYIHNLDQYARTQVRQEPGQHRRSADFANRQASWNVFWNRFASAVRANTSPSSGAQTSAFPSSFSAGTPRRNEGHNSVQRAASSDRQKMAAAQRQAPDPRTFTSTQTSVTISQPVRGFDVPELCRDADIRYIPAQNDYHHFYECIKGSAQIKTCPDGEVWVHPLRRCVNLNDQSNQIASHNPCIGSDLRFHPYPADPTKYVECQSWYRVYVWRCKDGLWTQNKQQCSTPTTHSTVGSRDTRSYTPQQSTVHVNFVGTRETPNIFTHCDNTTFYFAHPNPAKYVQCDQIGRSFVKDCAMNTTWDDSIKSCIQTHSVRTTDTSTNPATVDVMEHASRQLPDQESASYPCPVNYAWDVSENACIAVSPSDYLPACARGYMWDFNLGECVMYVGHTGAEESTDAEFTQSNCPHDLVWDKSLQMCVSHDDQMGANYDEYLYQVDFSDLDYSNQQPGQGYTDEDYWQTDDSLDYLPNICNVSTGRFYHPYPDQPHLFIQCDQLGVMHKQDCGHNKIWNNDIMTCVQHLSVFPGDSRQYPALSNRDNQNIFMGEICSESNVVYYPYQANKRMFIMCVNGVPEPMSCPAGSFWKDEITTCAWPNNN